MSITTSPVVLAGLILLALPACGNTSPVSMTEDPAASSLGIDLGSSSRVPRTQMAMAGNGHEAHIRAMSGAPAAKAELVHDGHSEAKATGTVNSVDAAQHKINLSHQPITSLGWPAMTMDFNVARSVDLRSIKAGSRVDFSLEKGEDGMYEIQSVQPVGAAR
jgi:Cu/Ag efflux protein CusF